MRRWPSPSAERFRNLDLQEFRGIVEPAERELAVPGPDRHVGNGVVGAGHEFVVGQVAVQYVELALGLHGEAVDAVFDRLGRVGVEVAETAAEIGGGAHLPEQPVQAFGAPVMVGGQKRAELLGQVEQNGAGFEQPGRRFGVVIHHRRDLGIGVDFDEAGGELVAFADIDQPGIVFGPGNAARQQFFQQYGDLDPVGRGQRIQLVRVLAHRQLLFVGRSGDRPVDAGELAAAFAFLLPDLRRRVVIRVAHGSRLLDLLWDVMLGDGSDMMRTGGHRLSLRKSSIQNINRRDRV